VKQLVNHNSRIEYTAIAEGSLRTIQRGASIQLERRGYFFVDQAATGQDNKNTIKLNFIPDGKSKNMSAISHKLDAKEIAGGKGKADGENRAEAKKLAGGEPAAEVNGGAEEVKELSKNELKKMQKKAEKKANKAAGGNEEGAEGKKVAAKGGVPKASVLGV